MDYALHRSTTRKIQFAYRSPGVVAAFEVSHRAGVPGHETSLRPAQSFREWVAIRAPSFLQRLPQRDFTVWLARTTHDCVRSPGGAYFALHPARRLRGVVARHPGRRCE